MRTTKLAMIAFGVCILFGVSMNAHAKLGFNMNGGRSSLVGAVKERLSNLSTRGSSTQKTPTKVARSDHDIKTKAPAVPGNARAKFAGVTKRFSGGLSPKGTPRGAQGGLRALAFGAGLTAAFGGAVGGGLALSMAPDAATFMNTLTLTGGVILGGFATMIGTVVTDRDF